MLRSVLAGLALGVVLLGANKAYAEPAYAPFRYPGTVAIHVSPAAPGLSYSIRLAPRGGIVGPGYFCRGPCLLYLLPGRYRLELFQYGRPMGVRTVRVDDDATWKVKPQNRTLEWVGLGTGVTGGALVMAGTFFWLSGFSQENQDSPDAARQRHLGIGLLAGGVAAEAVGWVLFAENCRLDVDTEPTGYAWLGRLRLGAAPARGGASFSAGLRF